MRRAHAAEQPAAPSIVVAVVSNSSWEVGIAHIDVANPKLILTQLSDNRAFAFTLTYLRDVNDAAGYAQGSLRVLYPESHKGLAITAALRERWDAHAVARSCFSR